MRAWPTSPHHAGGLSFLFLTCLAAGPSGGWQSPAPSAVGRGEESRLSGAALGIHSFNHHLFTKSYSSSCHGWLGSGDGAVNTTTSCP